MVEWCCSDKRSFRNKWANNIRNSTTHTKQTGTRVVWRDLPASHHLEHTDRSSCYFAAHFSSQTPAVNSFFVSCYTGGLVARVEESTTRTRDTDAHFFSCCAHVTVAQDTPSTHMRWLKNMWIVCFRVLIKSRSFVLCSVVHFLTYMIRSHHTAPHHLLQTSLLNAGMSMNPCASPQGGLFFGRMAEQSPLTRVGDRGFVDPLAKSSVCVSGAHPRSAVDFHERFFSTSMRWMRMFFFLSNDFLNDDDYWNVSSVCVQFGDDRN